MVAMINVHNRRMERSIEIHQKYLFRVEYK